jgi:transposase InsO family protein
VIWLNEFETVEEAKEKIPSWIKVFYNKLYAHSRLGYMSPEEFEDSYSHGKIKKIA